MRRKEMSKRRGGSRRGRSRKGGSTGTILIILSLIVALILVVSIFGYFWFQDSKRVELDSNFCPTDGPTRTVSILIDPTVHIGNATRLQLNNEIDREISTVEKHVKVQFLFVAGDGVSKAKFSYCNPGDFEKADWTVKSGLTLNPTRYKLRSDKFKKEISTILDKMVEEGTGLDVSPLLQALQITSLSVEKSKSETEKNKIIFITDLLENSEEFSVYNRGLANDALSFPRFLRSDAFKRYGFKNGDEFDLEILLVSQKNQGFKTVDIVEFWGQLLTKLNFSNFKIASFFNKM